MMIHWIIVTTVAIAILGLLSFIFKMNFWLMLIFYFVGIATTMLFRKSGK